MALSGTTLTVTTLTTVGLLTNNTSGQVSSVTGSSLASLLGGSPTFTGLTISGLGTGVLKATSGGIGLASAGDYQIPVSGSANINVSVGGVISTVSNPTFTSLTISGISGSMLKTVSNVLTGAVAYTDYMPAITAPSGSNLTINTSANTITVNSTPVFTNIANSTINTNNVLHGTGSGNGLTTGTANTLYGSGAGAAITTGTNIIALGYNAGAVVTTGSYNTYIGTGATASSTSVTNETVISNSASTVVGRGTNTMLLNAPSGVYGYMPAYFYGYFSLASSGTFTTTAISSKAITINTTNIVLPYIGTYNIILSGSININAGIFAIYHYVNGSPYPFGSLTNAVYWNNATAGYNPVSYNTIVTTASTNINTSFGYYTPGFGSISSNQPVFVTIFYSSL
jgi:hypothetical protein